jgi:hypothetical protein
MDEVALLLAVLEDRGALPAARREAKLARTPV